MKKLLAFLLTLVMCFGLLGCGAEKQAEETKAAAPLSAPQETEPKEKTPCTPLLYKVSDEKGNVIWLFGSIHIGREDFYPLPDYVMDAFQGSDALAVEVDVLAFEEDPSGQEAAFAQMTYTDGTTIADHLSKETYDKAVAALKELGLYKSGLENYMPVVWWSSLQSALYAQADGDANLGIDRYLLSLAKEEKKPVLEVESARAQYELLAGLSEQTQIFLLEQALVMHESPLVTALSLRILMNQWAAGQEECLVKYFGTQTNVPAKDQQAYNEYTQALAGQRDLDMTAYAVEALQSGEEIFICVGAAHIVGQGAVAENLRAMGYTVEIVR